MGVWIETYETLHFYAVGESHPAWVCGLKHAAFRSGAAYQSSHPAWVCGLKLPDMLVGIRKTFVTPCVGVWIETVPEKITWKDSSSHPAWVCGLKH